MGITMIICAAVVVIAAPAGGVMLILASRPGGGVDPDRARLGGALLAVACLALVIGFALLFLPTIMEGVS